MRILFDTDVIIDLLSDRRPFSELSAKLVMGVELGVITGYLCATSVTTIHYLTAKSAGRGKAREHVERLLAMFQIAPVTRSVLEAALALGFHDFEDAVASEAARQAGAQAIVTRNSRDFHGSAVPVHSPADMLAILAALEGAGDSGRADGPGRRSN